MAKIYILFVRYRWASPAMLASEDGAPSLYYPSCNRQTKRLGDPIANVITADGAIVRFAMFDCVIVGREDAQFALGAVDRLFIALVRKLDGNLTITRPMRDEKRNSNLVDYAVQAHRGRPGHERVDIGLAEYPHHVVPVMGNRILALAVTTALLQFAPVVVRTQNGTKRKTLFKRRSSRRKVSAQREPKHADP